MNSTAVSIVIPTLNEAAVIASTLTLLQPLRSKGFEIIVVDGGSSDTTVVQTEPLVDRLVTSEKGRACQMNAGAAVAKGQWLLFLHSDTQLPSCLDQWLLQLNNSGFSWGFFPLCLDGKHWFFRCLEKTITARSQITRVATGDQSLFVLKTLFNQVNHYPDIPLMEDVALCKLLRKISNPFIGSSPVITSSRRWEQHGKLKTVVLMWSLRLAYALGVSPKRLHNMYYDQ